MALDTRNKRASVIGLDAPYRAVYPNPDVGAEGQDDRQQIAYKYPGILAGGFVPPVAGNGGAYIIIFRRRRRE